MRTGRERIRYTVTFEVVLMAMLIPSGAMFFDRDLLDIGLLGLILLLKAMLLGLGYNWLFDKIDARSGNVASDRSAFRRVLHAIGFEVFLTLTSLPIYMWWLDLGLLKAFSTDLVVTTFVVIYTYLFTLIYDLKYPVGSP